MKKIIFLATLLAGIAISGAVLLILYSGAAWKNDAVCDIQANPKIIALVKRNVFAADCPCLVFQKGTLYHGQDTFEVMKFNIDLADLSWNAVTNRLVTLGGGNINPVGSPLTANYDLPPILRNLADDKEQMIGEFFLDQTSVYVTINTEFSHWHMYLVGSIVPFEHVELIKR